MSVDYSHFFDRLEKEDKDMMSQFELDGEFPHELIAARKAESVEKVPYSQQEIQQLKQEINVESTEIRKKFIKEIEKINIANNYLHAIFVGLTDSVNQSKMKVSYPMVNEPQDLIPYLTDLSKAVNQLKITSKTLSDLRVQFDNIIEKMEILS